MGCIQLLEEIEPKIQLYLSALNYVQQALKWLVVDMVLWLTDTRSTPRR
jgi:hypothetical protein